MKRARCVVFVFTVCAAMEADAQSTAVVGSRNRVNPSSEDWLECSVAARLTDHNELVVTANLTTGTPGFACAISENGGADFGIEYFTLGRDSGAVVDPSTDRIWVSVLGPYACTPCTSIAYRDPEDDVLSSDFYAAVDPSQVFLDKPLMGISPGGRHFITYLQRPGEGCSHGAWSSYSDDPTDEQVWEPIKIEPDGGDGCEFEGWGQKPVVLDDGRVVVVFRGKDAGYNNDLPVVAYSDDDGLSWDPDDEEPVPVAESSDIEVIQPFQGNGAGDTPEFIDERLCAPDIAVDRTTEPNDVYVSFYARAERGDATSGDHNSDVYISKSVDTGGVLSYPGNDPAYLVQLTDDMLGLTSYDDGPDQVMPSIAIDPCGGVSVVFYDNRNDPDWSDDEHWLDVYYVRITDYGGDNDVQQVRLTPNSFQLSDVFLGNYHHMAYAGPQPTLYPAYIANHHNCYVNKVSILCSLDFAGYGGTEEEACAMFEKLSGDGVIDGDLNGDEAIDAEDAAIFYQTLETRKDRGGE